ncbi:pectin lyase-like protein [Lindgomyces ingoldianus]|uniref:Pectin lyase-like protein n=1 Tax=Lindgomyces ingoldianus TaxID=673940 RepID=A0ACB6QWB6_9PLEO|nr:pectin lyase-like protein [Lindgomyces ingoldianus]KAF2470873.1 pectin lyase-like protein [Lindgomyces ingoldianus]
MILTLFFLTLLTSSNALPSTLSPREICTPASFSNPSKDDTPAILSALQKCGNGGRILLPKGTTYTIRSPIDLSACQACDFQINGLLGVSTDWNFWSGQHAVFTIISGQAAVIRSDGNTGIINANSYGVTTSYKEPSKTPKLFSITNSSNIHFSGLKLKNVYGTAFEVTAKTTGMYFYDMDIGTEDSTAPPTDGFQISDAKHVYINNNTIRADGACVMLLPNASNVQVEDTTCITSGSTNLGPSGIEFQLVIGTGLSYVRNILVKNFRAIGTMNVVALWTGQETREVHTIEIANATFDNVTMEGPVKQAVYLEQCRPGWCDYKARLNVTGTSFRKFKGAALKGSEIKCLNKEDVCGFSEEGWNVKSGG